MSTPPGSSSASDGFGSGTPDRPQIAVFAPAPVLVCTFEHHDHEGTPPDVNLNVGGQGPWVSRALTSLGAEPVLVAPFGGQTGELARFLLAGEEGLALRAVHTRAASACYVEERRAEERTCVREAAPGVLGQRELDDLYSATLAAALDCGVCVITGSAWEEAVAPSLIRRLATDLATLGVATVADLSKKQLDAALDGGVDWLKVAHDELLRDFRCDDDSEESLWEAAASLRGERGARTVVVSRAAEQPSLVLSPEGRFKVAAPRLTTVDARGSGDTMTAAIAVGVASQRSLDATLRIAAAAGAANAVRKGTANPDAALIAGIERNVTLACASDRDRDS